MDKLHFKNCKKKNPFFNVEDDGNINPYATFNQMKQVIMEKEQQSERDKSPDLDDISLQKLEAQKAVCLLFFTILSTLFECDYDCFLIAIVIILCDYISLPHIL